MDQESIDTLTEQGTVQEIKEWQAIMDHLRSLPVEGPGRITHDPSRCPCRGGAGNQSGLIGFGRLSGVQPSTPNVRLGQKRK